MIFFAPAKINIGLYITSKRADCYHNLETVFYPIPLYDIVEIVEHSKLSIEEYGISSQSDFSQNLCIKAYNLLKNDFKLPNVKIFLLKNIPIQAGLGGGSSDAVAVLHLLNSKFDLQINETDLLNYALHLGSDCPFFINPQPYYASGRGELLENINISLNGKILYLVKPNVSISTAEAFKQIFFTNNSNLKNNIQKEITTWKKNINNTFQKVFFNTHFDMQYIIKTLYDAGAIYTSISGSGSTFYGIFDKEIDIASLFPQDWYTHKISLTH